LNPERAANLMRDEEFVAELTKLHELQIQTIVNSLEHDVDVRENAYRMIKALSVIRSHFQSIADTKEIERKRWKIL
jgi:hypothetical protein